MFATHWCGNMSAARHHSYFLIDIPCHPDFINDKFVLKTNVTKDVTKDVTKELSERQKLILKMIEDDAYVTVVDMSQKTGVVTRTIKRDLEYLRSQGIIAREGGRKEGHWVIQATKSAFIKFL